MAAVCMGQEEELKQLEAVKTMAAAEVEPSKHLVARVQLDYNYITGNKHVSNFCASDNFK